MANGHIHVWTKFSNKSVNHEVETSPIHTNTEAHHVYLNKSTTLIKKKIKNKK
jgi:hypothetical protein